MTIRARKASSLETLQTRPCFTDLILPLIPVLKKLALKLTRNMHDSEDLLQAVLLKVVEQSDRIHEIQALRAWLSRVMYHHFIDECRRRTPINRAVSLDDINHFDSIAGIDGAWGSVLSIEDETPELQLEQTQISEFVHAAINGLSNSQRELVTLHELKGLTVNSIASQLGMPVNTVKSSLGRARTLLRGRLEAAQIADPVQNRNARAQKSKRRADSVKATQLKHGANKTLARAG